MRPDFYHSLYSIAGLSATQYHYVYDVNAKNLDGDDDTAFKWVVTEQFEGEEGDRVETVHPIFVLPWGAAERTRSWFRKRGNASVDIA